MANKQTAGLQLIDFKGIDMAQGPQTIKGIYQQVTANKLMKTITNLVYDGYAYDDFPITLTTTDGLTYTGKYIDTVSSEMLQWLSITITNKSEATVTKELFEGGGGGYEEITEGTPAEKMSKCDLAVVKFNKKITGTLQRNRLSGTTNKLSLISEIKKDENGNVTDVIYSDKSVYIPKHETIIDSSNFLFVKEGDYIIFRFNNSFVNNKYTSHKPVASEEVMFSSNDYVYSPADVAPCVLSLRYNTLNPEITSSQSMHGNYYSIYSISTYGQEVKFYRDKNLSKFLESI